MPLPTNRELREMLDEATPGTWYTCDEEVDGACVSQRLQAKHKKDTP